MTDERRTEREIKLLAEVTAHRFLLIELAKRLYLATGITPEAARELHVQLLLMSEQVGISGIDPAMSDHFSAEIQSALASILRDIER